MSSRLFIKQRCGISATPSRVCLVVRSGVDHETTAILAETVGAVPRVSIAHEVTSIAAILDSLNLPVAVSLDHLTNIADGRAKILNTVLVERLTGVNAPSTGEVIDDLTLLGKSVVCHNDYIPK